MFGAALAFYWMTLAPTVTWGDSASLATRAFLKQFEFATAGDHPFFILIASWFTHLPGDVARNVNLASAVFGALAVMLVFRCARQLGAGLAASVTGAAALCVSHAFWYHAVVAEVYTANAFFLTATFTLLLDWRRTGQRRYLAGALMTFALGLTNHLVLGTAAPAVVTFVMVTRGRTTIRRDLTWAACVVAVVAVAVWLLLPADVSRVLRRFWYGPPSIAEYFDPRVPPGALIAEAAYYIGYLCYQFPSMSLPLGAAGAATLWRRDRAAAALLLVAWGVNALVFVAHTVWPSATGMKFVFYITDYAIFAVLSAVGAEALLRASRVTHIVRQRVGAAALIIVVAALPPITYAVTPPIAERVNVLLVRARALPYRDNNRFFLNPSKRREQSARRFGTEALQAVAPGAVIFADYTPYAVLKYLQVVEHRRPDVLVLSSTPADPVVRVREVVDKDGHSRPIYVASAASGLYDLGGSDLTPAGPIFAVDRRANHDQPLSR